MRPGRPGRIPGPRERKDGTDPATGRRTVAAGAFGSAELPSPAHRIAALRCLDAEDPDGRWFLALAAALRDEGRALEAVQVVRRGLAHDADCASGWVVLGQCYLALSELAAARRVLEGALRRDPDNALALRCLAILNARLGERAVAAGYYRSLLKLVPRDLAAQEALAMLLEPGEAADADGAAAPADGAAAAFAGEVSAGPRSRPRASAARPARSAPPVPYGARSLLPPETRPRPGLFEPPPHDLDWERPASARAPRRGGAGRSQDDARARAAASGPARPAKPASTRAGYRRWLEQLMSEEASAERRRARGDGSAPAGGAPPPLNEG